MSPARVLLLAALGAADLLGEALHRLLAALLDLARAWRLRRAVQRAPVRVHVEPVEGCVRCPGGEA